MIQRLQREIEGRLSDLDRLSKLYRELARHGRNDVAGELRQKVDDASRRWESAAKSIQAVGKRLDRARSISLDLDESMESLTVWLNDVDVRLTRLKHLSDDTSLASKITTLKVILVGVVPPSTSGDICRCLEIHVSCVSHNAVSLSLCTVRPYFAN